jgi:riboflavin kinase/FMN adenylyltransferase
MQILHGINQLKKYPKPVVAMGVFDGVHRGHRSILRQAVACARRINGRSIALTFWPHPQKEKSLYSLEHRLRLIASFGIDACAVVNFNSRFAGMEAEDFVKNILARKLGARYVYVGKNFRFGRSARGDYKVLKRLAKVYGFRLKLFKVLKTKNTPISSTVIRGLIRAGKLSVAQKLLGRPVSVLGTVVRGASFARKLGFPTANINPHHEVIPPSGVYAVNALIDRKRFNGLCNIGFNPTFNQGSLRDPHIELHIFNFQKNIYAKPVEIRFIRKIREEKKFPTAFALIEQIEKDIKVAHALFSRH